MIENYSINDIRQRVEEKVFKRGEGYATDGHIRSVIRRGDALFGQVYGSAGAPYGIHITLWNEGIEAAQCSCPYDWGGWCKHIVAVLLYALDNPITERPTLEELLDGQDREALVALLEARCAESPSLLDWIDTHFTDWEDEVYDEW